MPTSPANDPLAAIYRELRALAAHSLQHPNAGQTLQPTALVHEAWLRLANNRDLRWNSQSHFFAISAGAIRNVLVDHARARNRDKRGGGAQRLTLSSALPESSPSTDTIDLLALDEALRRLTTLDPRQAHIVELRFFAGLTVAEIAAELDISERTVKNDWRMAKAWLRVELADT